MPSHKFQIGETVYVRPAISRNVPGGAYEVAKQLPHNGREFEYRIKSANEEHEDGRRPMRDGEESSIQGRRCPTTMEQAEYCSYQTSTIVVLPVRREREQNGE
jgi:hypothetical protein